MTSSEVRFAWMNGEVGPWPNGSIDALDQRAGISEAIRCYETPEGPAVFRLDEHLDRLFKSAQLHGVRIPYLKNEIGSAVCQVIEANRFTSCHIRPVVFSGRVVDVAVVTWPWELQTRHVQAGRGAENLFLVHDGRIRTNTAGEAAGPDVAHETITVIARELGYTVEEGELSAEDLTRAEEAFFTDSSPEVIPIRELEGRLLGDGQPGHVTRSVQRAVAEAVSGRTARYRKWLHFVDQCWLAGAYSALPCI